MAKQLESVILYKSKVFVPQVASLCHIATLCSLCNYISLSNEIHYMIESGFTYTLATLIMRLKVLSQTHKLLLHMVNTNVNVI